MGECVFCQRAFSDREHTAILAQKGCNSIIISSIVRYSDITVAIDQVVHVNVEVNLRLIQLHMSRKLVYYMQHKLRSEKYTYI